MELPQGIINACPTATLAPPASHVFFTLINALMASRCALGPENRYPSDYGNSLHDGDEFDFIIVGAGSAGAVVANRLSQVKDWKILLLEAGSYPSAMSEIPAFLFSLQNTTEDWQYKMQPSKTCCLGLKGNVCPCPRGKVLGGSSLLNAMIYVRGNPRDYNGWAEAGNVGWDYESVLKQYKKFEGCQDPNHAYYEKNGELKLTRYKLQQPIRGILEDAYKELGLYREYTEENPTGFWDCFMTTNKGTRFSTAKSFIQPIKGRRNLYVALNAQVAKLLVDKSDIKTVHGVEVRIDGKILQIKAKKEVILSAGSINSPQILMNSGIGPKEHLESLGIDVVANLRVGENLQDHPMFPLFISIDKSVIHPKSDFDKLDEIYQYFMHRSGPLTGIELTNFIGFLNTKNNSIFPDLQLHHTMHEPNDLYLLQIIARSTNLPDELLETFQETNKHNCNMFFLLQVMKPKSVGKILIGSADPFDKPLIYPNYLSDENNEDLEVLLQAIKILKKVVQTETLTQYKAKVIEFTLPNCREYDFDTDDFWRCAIRNIGSHIYHQVGTCKMGPEGDPTAVVDPRLKVHGMKGVRVIDGSIMPTITSGNTNGPIIMIGEKGAELIKEDWLQNIHEEL